MGDLIMSEKLKQHAERIVQIIEKWAFVTPDYSKPIGGIMEHLQAGLKDKDMRESIIKYQNDPIFHYLTDTFVKLMKEKVFTANEIREIIDFAEYKRNTLAAEEIIQECEEYDKDNIG